MPLNSTANFENGVTGALIKVAEVKASGVGPGQTSGTGLALTMTIRNGTSRAIDLSSTVVNLYAGASRTPGDPADGAPNSPFRGTLAAGKTASATYVFRVDDPKAEPLVVTVSYSPAAPVVTFKGSRS